MYETSPCRSARTHRLSISILLAFLSPAVTVAEFEFTKIGNPTWEPLGGFISAVDFRNDPKLDYGEEGKAFIVDAFSPSHAYIESLDLIVPVEPHSGPYENEYRDIIARNGGFESDVFLASDLLGSDRIYRGFVIAPTEGSPTGASVGGGNSLIIDPDVFPITGKWTHEYRNEIDLIGGCVDCEPFVVENLNDMGVVTDNHGNTHDLSGQNWNHMPHAWTMGYTGNPSISEISGEYEGVLEYRDAQENGWDMSFFYTVVPRRTRVDGDLNFDSEVDMSDLDIAVKNVAVGSTHRRLDLNDDDVVDLSDVHFWVTDLKNTWVGDANLDGEFNSGDFVQVFSAGKYETDELAIWSEGDWNADKRFDSGDFIVAFQDGGYETGARSAVAAVPEPSSLLMLTLGMLGIGRIRKR